MTNKIRFDVYLLSLELFHWDLKNIFKHIISCLKEKSVYYLIDFFNFKKFYTREGNFGKKRKIWWTKWLEKKWQETGRRYIAIEHRRRCCFCCLLLPMFLHDYLQSKLGILYILKYSKVIIKILYRFQINYFHFKTII
jgi:hypothetical protein